MANRRLEQGHIVLVHGYGQALDPDEAFSPRNGGFYSFDAEIERGIAHPFIWAQDYERNTLTPYNLYAQYDLYTQERALIFSEEVQQSLRKMLYDVCPRIIIAHSLGGYLVRNVCEYLSVPDSLKQIVLLQADIPKSVSLPYIQRIEWINFWCWWDMSLTSSLFINQETPIGLGGSNQSHVQDVFRKIEKGPKGHKRVLSSKKYKEDIYDVIRNS